MGSCTRVQWSPPLRENFSYPFILMEMYCISVCLKYYNKPFWDLNTKNGRYSYLLLLQRYSLTQMLKVAWCTWTVLVTWQFSQFVLTTQLVVLVFMFTLNLIDKLTLLVIVFGQIIGVILADIALFGNEMLLCSVFTCMLICIPIFVLCLEHLFEQSLVYYRLFTLTLLCLAAILLKIKMTILFGNADDSHVIYIILSKLSKYKDFHTLLYTCAPEFDFLPMETVQKLGETFLLPAAGVALLTVMATWLYKFLVSNLETSGKSFSDFGVELSVMYNILQLCPFIVMTVLIMRLKLFLTPHLCILTSLLAARRYFRFIHPQEFHWAILAILIGGMSVKGFENLESQRSIIGEYRNVELEQLLTWVNTMTTPKAVFAGPMPVMANLMLSTRRPIVNHPHYENAALRERTKKVYSAFSRKTPQEVFNILTELQVEYLVLEEAWCFRGTRGGCSLLEIWDVEEPKNVHNQPVCPILFLKNSPLFHRVFANDIYVVLRLHTQYVEIRTVKEYKL